MRDPTRIGRQTEMQIVKVLAFDDVEHVVLQSRAYKKEPNPFATDMQSNFRQQLLPVRGTQDLGYDWENGGLQG